MPNSNYDNTPTSRFEEDMRAIIDGTTFPDRPPRSKMEELLEELNDAIKAGGGGGGTSTIAWKPTVAADGTISWIRTASETKPEDQNIKGPDGDPGLGIKLVSINQQGHLIITYDDDTTQDAGAIPGGGGAVDPPVINLEGIASENDVNTKSATFTAVNTATYLLIEVIAGDTFPIITSFSATVNGDDVNLNEYYSDSAHINSKYAILNLEAGDTVTASVMSSIGSYGTSASIMLIKLSSPIQNLVLKASDAKTSGECAVDFNTDNDGFYLLFFLDRREGSGIDFNTIKLNDETITKNRIICQVSDGWEVRQGMCIASAKALDNFKVSSQARGYADAVGIFYVETGSSGGGSAELTDDLTTAVTVGGIESGTTYEEGTPLEDILRDMLDPVMYPTLTNPSVSLAGSGSKLLETGATLAVTLTATFNRGSINPAYGTSGYRSGAVTGYSLNSGTSQQGNTWSETVSSANKTFKCTASYAAGEQPKDSKGNNYSSPLAAGSVESGNVTYDFVDAMWANTAAIGTIAKLSLVAKSAKQRDMQFPAQTVANPEVFDIPASWTVTAVQVKNDLSGQYEDASDQFTITDTTHNDAAGNSVNYNRYTFNKGFDTGARTVRVKWS